MLHKNKTAKMWSCVYNKTLIGFPDPQMAFIASAILVLTNSNIYINNDSKINDLFDPRCDGFEKQIYIDKIKNVFNINVKGEDLIINIVKKISMEGLWVK